MKITIQHYTEKASIETEDHYDLDHFQETLTRLLRFMWLPEQVDQIMRVKDYEEGYEAARTAINKDTERLEWLLDEYGVRWDITNDSRVTREGIDKEMAEELEQDNG